VIYSYEGSHFDEVRDSDDVVGEYSVGNRVFGYFEIADVLDANLDRVDIRADLMGFEFSDGKMLRNYSNTPLDAIFFSFRISTDASADVIEWDIELDSINFGDMSLGDRRHHISTRNTGAIPGRDDFDGAFTQICTETGITFSGNLGCVGAEGDWGRVIAAPGTWTVFAVTEPTTILLFVAGAAAISLRRNKQQ
jgi:hypothetical protein